MVEDRPSISATRDNLRRRARSGRAPKADHPWRAPRMRPACASVADYQRRPQPPR